MVLLLGPLPLAWAQSSSLPSFTSPSTVSGQTEEPFGTYTLSATGNPSYSLSGSLPPGLTYDANTAGISGTPTQPGTYVVTMGATNSSGTATAALTITIVPEVAPVITSSSTVNGTVGALLEYDIASSRFTTSFSIVSGTLPPGLAVYEHDSVIDGFPTQAGTFSITVGATNSGGTGTKLVTFTITGPPAPVILTAPFTTGTVGSSYTYSIVASGSPTSYGLVAGNGTLPPGLTLNTATGVISGTPTQAGLFTFMVSATNASGTGTSSQVITALAAPSPPPVFLNGPTSNGTVGSSFTIFLDFSGSPTSYGLVSGTLPPGLTFNAGFITGVPTQAGTYSVTFSATNAGGTGSGVEGFVIVNPGIVPMISKSPSNGYVGVPFTYPIVASQNPTSYSLLSGSLPAGFTLDTATGLISGTPTQAGTFSFLVGATNATGTGTALVVLTFSATAPPAGPLITSSSNANGTVGSSLTYSIVATGSPTSYNLVSGSLPPGLTLNTATGVISGTPTQQGNFGFTVGAINASGTGTAGVTLSIAPAAPGTVPTVASKASPNGIVGSSYTYSISATNSPTSYGIVGGTLPPGLTLNTATGVISGIPTQAGTFTLTIDATNASGLGTGTAVLSILSADPTAVPTITSNLGASGTVGSSFTYSIAATGFPTSYRLVSGTLPSGLTLNPVTGVISGTPTQQGNFGVTIGATNAGGTGTSSVLLSISPVAPPISAANGSDLANALATCNGNPTTAYQITFTGPVSLGAPTTSASLTDLRSLAEPNPSAGLHAAAVANSTAAATATTTLPMINSSSNVTIEGQGNTLDGGGTQHGFIVNSGTVTIQDLVIQNTLAQGVAGGGIGAGGALYVAPGTSVTLNNVSFGAVGRPNSAIGGGGGGLAGGLGEGGAIYAAGGVITVTGSLTIAGNSAAGGSGNPTGPAFGSGIFLAGNDSNHGGSGALLTFAPDAGQTQTISDVVADQSGSGGPGANAGIWGLTQNGAGTLVLSGANTFTGEVAVMKGLLAVDNSTGSGTGSGDVTVANNATVTGTGKIAGNLVAQSGAFLAPGAGIGTLSVGGATTWNGAAEVLARLSGGDSTSSLLAITGSLTKGGSGSYLFDFQGTGAVGKTYTLATFASTNFTASDFSSTGLPAGLSGTFVVSGNQLQLSVVAAAVSPGSTGGGSTGSPAAAPVSSPSAASPSGGGGGGGGAPSYWCYGALTLICALRMLRAQRSQRRRLAARPQFPR